MTRFEPVGRKAVVGYFVWLVLGAGCGSIERAGEQTGELRFAPAAADTLVAELQIGTEAGRPEEALGNVADIEVGPDGSIYVLDFSVPTVRIFGPDGRYLRSIGRSGEGPGEFRRPQQLTVAPDGRLWVYDATARAVLVLSPDGTELARYPSTPSGLGPLSFIWDGAVGTDGKLVQTVQRSDPRPAGATGVLDQRVRLYVRSLDPATGTVDSVYLREDPFRPSIFRGQTPDGGVSTAVGIVPFDARRIAARDKVGNVWTALSTEYVIERWGPAGDTLTVRLDVQAEPFTPEDRASWEEREKEMPLGLTLPERGHVLWRLFTDDEDRLWVQRAARFEPTGHFDVFSSGGELLGSVFLPGRSGQFATFSRGGDLYAATYDNLGIARVIRAPVPFLR